jgi:hypothetical protein
MRDTVELRAVQDTVAQVCYPDWLEFHTFTFGGPVANVRSRSGVVRVEAGRGETADSIMFGIPDDDDWADLSEQLSEAGFWNWPLRTSHREPHSAGDWYWWLEVREGTRQHRAADWKDAPPTFSQVRLAVFELVERVLK